MRRRHLNLVWLNLGLLLSLFCEQKRFGFLVPDCLRLPGLCRTLQERRRVYWYGTQIGHGVQSWQSLFEAFPMNFPLMIHWGVARASIDLRKVSSTDHIDSAVIKNRVSIVVMMMIAVLRLWTSSSPQILSHRSLNDLDLNSSILSIIYGWSSQWDRRVRLAVLSVLESLLLL